MQCCGYNVYYNALHAPNIFFGLVFFFLSFVFVKMKNKTKSPYPIRRTRYERARTEEKDDDDDNKRKQNQSNVKKYTYTQNTMSYVNKSQHQFHLPVAMNHKQDRMEEMHGSEEEDFTCVVVAVVVRVFDAMTRHNQFKINFM